MVEDRDLAEGMALEMLGLFGLPRQHVQVHLLELRTALFREQHLDRTDIGRAVEAP